MIPGKYFGSVTLFLLSALALAQPAPPEQPSGWVAKQAVIKAGQYAYRDRRQRKRQFRALWIVRINAAARGFGLSYSRFINGLSRAGIEVDRKVLADLAVHDLTSFGALAERSKVALAA